LNRSPDRFCIKCCSWRVQVGAGSARRRRGRVSRPTLIEARAPLRGMCREKSTFPRRR
jgi:hypothetical protein